MPNTVLAFDIGGTKTAWAIVDEEGTLGKRGEFATPQDRETFLAQFKKVVDAHADVAGVGIGIAGTVSANHKNTLVCPNIPELSHLELSETVSKPCAIDNDGRCALIGEAWLGAATDTSSAVMITLGTGVGGAVMQRYKVLPHPTDLSLEISHLVADPDDYYPAKAGRGTIEALIGGKNIEARYEVSLAEMSGRTQKDDTDATEFWQILQHAFHQCIRAIHEAYGCRMIIVGGRGVKDLPLYLGGNPTPCPVIPAKLGPDAGLYGAARLGFDAVEEDAKDWDEE
ncbi:MAG TPA: ROK family protein [Verrucomicrobiae bacterium]|nr:ROK family protein [Verrucomicrobiae bacterium]